LSDLASLSCVPCRGGEPPLSPAEIAGFMPQAPDWSLIEVGGIQRLERQYKFENFAQALAFTNRIGGIADAEDHHPALLTEWGRVTVSWWTHIIKGLHRNDFIMAARSDILYQGGDVGKP